jgi:hypothetical protein
MCGSINRSSRRRLSVNITSPLSVLQARKDCHAAPWLGLIAVLVSVVALGAQQASARLERAVERIERNDVNGLRRLLKEDPSLVRRTEAGVLPTWRWTLLHCATAAPASLEIVAALIDAGAEIKCTEPPRETVPE